MRGLDECTAEVFRRSEKRIKERRRNRNRIFAACIPICLIVTVWSVVNLPARMQAGETSRPAQSDGELVGDAPGSFVCPYTAVEIQDADLFPAESYGKVTDTPAVAEIYHAIDLLFSGAIRYDGDIGENSQAAENKILDMTDSGCKAKECTITFTAEDGSRAVYDLNGNTLMNVSTNETIFLSDSQAAGLLAVLGISE